MRLSTIDYFSLWQVGSEGGALTLRQRLERLTKQAAIYFGLDHDVVVPLIEQDSLIQALNRYSHKLGLVSKKLSSFSPKILSPLLARDRATNELVLLLPHQQNGFLVHDGEHVVRLVKRAEISHLFSDFVVLLAAHSEYPFIRLQRYLTHLIPHKTIMVALLLLCGIGGILSGLISWYSEKAFSLMTFSVALIVLLCGIFLTNYIFFINSKNFTAAFSLSSAWITQKIFSQPRDYLNRLSHNYSDQIYHKLFADIKLYFLQRYRLLGSYFFAAFLLIALAWFNPLLAVFESSLLLVILQICHKLLAMMKTTEKRSLDTQVASAYALNALHASFAMVNGLHAQGALLQRIEHYQKQHSHARQQHQFLRNLTTMIPLMAAIIFLLVLIIFCLFGHVQLSFSRDVLVLLQSAFVGMLVHEWLQKPLNHMPLASLDNFADTPEKTLRVAPLHIKGTIELADVSFHYQESSEPVIKYVTLTLTAGQFYQITGPSGAGKSTLMKLLLGMLPTEGQIFFDGQDVRSLDRDLLSAHFGVVPQEVEVFLGTVYDNIVCGRSVADRTLEKLLMSHELFDVLLDLPMGLQSYVFHRGRNLSRAQIIAIALARALVSAPKILFMDEIFKGIDGQEQKIIVDFLAKLSLTRVMVVHEPVTIPSTIIKVAEHHVKILS